MRGWLAILGLLAVAGGCVATRLEDYEASPLSGREGREGRLAAEVEGVRVQAGPPAVFPYANEAGRRRIAGRYQLYTRIAVENGGSEPVQVDWSGVRLVQPEGDTLALVPVGADGAPEGSAPGALRPEAETGASMEGIPASPERMYEHIAPGGVVTRSLLPASFREIGVDEPMVALCDDCEYQLLVPVVIGGRRREVRLGFRMNAVEYRERRARFLFWQ